MWNYTSSYGLSKLRVFLLFCETETKTHKKHLLKKFCFLLPTKNICCEIQCSMKNGKRIFKQKDFRIKLNLDLYWHPFQFYLYCKDCVWWPVSHFFNDTINAATKRRNDLQVICCHLERSVIYRDRGFWVQITSWPTINQRPI